jgi:alanyl-tRNA synthetase
LNPKEWSECISSIVGGGSGGKGNQFTGTSNDVTQVELAVEEARKLLEQRLHI